MPRMQRHWINALRYCALLVPASLAAQTAAPDGETWLDHTHSWVYETLWRSAMKIDGAFGSEHDAGEYQKLYGSITPALLWDEFRGFQPKLRFTVNVPLPQLNERFHAIIGRVNPDEFITESARQSGALPRQFGPPGEDETVFGLSYRTAHQDSGDFGYGAGVRVRFPLDPYVKADYTYAYGSPRALLLTWKQTVFWKQSEHAGTTSRLDLDHFLSPLSLLRFTAAATLSQRSLGVRGFSDLSIARSLAARRAVIGMLSIDWETRAPVPLHEFGFEAGYRQSIFRDWLILEVRSSLTWPKEVLGTARVRSWGVGMGFEMLIGTTQFQALPVTF